MTSPLTSSWLVNPPPQPPPSPLLEKEGERRAKGGERQNFPLNPPPQPPPSPLLKKGGGKAGPPFSNIPPFSSPLR